MKPIRTHLLLTVTALASCAHQHECGSFTVFDDAPITLSVRSSSPADVTIRLWNAGDGEAQYELTGSADGPSPISSGWGYRYENSEMPGFEMTFSTTTRVLIGYDITADRDMGVTVQHNARQDSPSTPHSALPKGSDG